MTILDEIIDASSDPSVSSPDLLRKVQVAAHRVGANQIVAWVKLELYGYDETATLPTYRRMRTNVVGRFSGYMQSWMEHELSVVPTGMDDLWTVELREPLLELQAMSESETDLVRGWGSPDVEKFARSGAFRLQNHSLFTARNVVTRQSLRGVLDIVRSKALEFALELQSQSTEAGSVGGPKVVSGTPLAQTVYNITNTIYGDGANIAAGEHISQTSYVAKGDEAGFRREVKALGLSESDVEEFVATVIREQSVNGKDTRGFLERVKSGAISLSGSLASNVAAGALVDLGASFLGLS